MRPCGIFEHWAIRATKPAGRHYRLAVLGLSLFLAAVSICAMAVPGGSARSFVSGSLVAPSLRAPTSFVYPIMTPRLSSEYGIRIHPIRRFSSKHQGIDLAVPRDTPIRAVAEGVVVFADPYAGYGNLVVLRHGDSMTTHYAHCESIWVKPGQRVKGGEIIATVGSSGLSTAPHLHFEIRVDGIALDPELVIPGLASEAKG